MSFTVVSLCSVWVVGALVNNIWSFAGDSNEPDVNAFLVQYFVNYNLKNGWYLTTAPIITANWEAPADDQWTLPFGGGVGRVFNIGAQPVNMSLQAYDNVITPEQGPDWQLRSQTAAAVSDRRMTTQPRNRTRKQE